MSTRCKKTGCNVGDSVPRGKNGVIGSYLSYAKLTHTQTHTQNHSYSDSLLLRLIIPWSAQAQTYSHSDCLTSIPTHTRLTRTQTHSHSHFLTLRPTQAQTHTCSDSSCSDPLNHRLAHTQTRSHSGPLALRRTRVQIYSHAYPLKLRLAPIRVAIRLAIGSHSYLQTVGISRAKGSPSHTCAH